MSNLICPISDATLLSVIRGALGPAADIVDRILMTGGTFNTTYRVKTSSPAEDLVIRLAPIRRDLLYRFEQSLQRAEVELYGQLKSMGIPVPTVLKHDDSHALVDREYIITGYIEGVTLKDLQGLRPVLPEVSHFLGAYCHQIHGIQGEGFGWFGLRHDGGLSKTWHGYLSEFFEEIADRSERFGVTPGKYIGKLQGILSKGFALFPDPPSASLLHNDLHPGNVLLRKDGEQYGICAFIDVDRALFGDPEFEFGTSDLISPEFMVGYGRPLDMSPEAVFRRKVYSILKNMMDADACLVQIGNVRIHEFLEKCIEMDCDSL